jgi:D-alanine-D-alanine ligase
MNIGIAYDLKSEYEGRVAGPDDRLEEYDSAETVDAIARALAAHGHEPVLLGSGRAFLERVLARRPDLVFNIAEGFGTRSREAHVPSACEMLDIPVTHSDPLTLAVTLDKAMAKRLVAAAGVATPSFATIENAREIGALDLEYPLIAKPLFEGSSMGIRRSSRVGDADALEREVRRLVADYSQPVLVEEFCSGLELTVGIVGNGEQHRVASQSPSSSAAMAASRTPHVSSAAPRASRAASSADGAPQRARDGYFIAAMEIAPKVDAPDKFVYSLEVKRNWRNEVEYHVPPRCDERTLRAVKALALDAFRALDCRDVARVDVRLNSRGEPRFLEINPLPGLNPTTGDLVIACERSGLAYEELIARIVENARARYGI